MSDPYRTSREMNAFEARYNTPLEPSNVHPPHDSKGFTEIPMTNIRDPMSDPAALRNGPELDSLVSAIHSGVIVMPSETVRQTTILVTPGLWDDLQDRIASDTEKEPGHE